jgi:hypothetical protein
MVEWGGHHGGWGGFGPPSYIVKKCPEPCSNCYTAKVTFSNNWNYTSMYSNSEYSHNSCRLNNRIYLLAFIWKSIWVCPTFVLQITTLIYAIKEECVFPDSSSYAACAHRGPRPYKRIYTRRTFSHKLSRRNPPSQKYIKWSKCNKHTYVEQRLFRFV